MNPSPPALLRLSPQDNCAIALRALSAGERLDFEGSRAQIHQNIALGHKVALVALRPADKVRRYGALIGSVTTAVEPGEHLHVHNLQSDYLPTYTLDATGFVAPRGTDLTP